jgi:hypothetical protein
MELHGISIVDPVPFQKISERFHAVKIGSVFKDLAAGWFHANGTWESAHVEPGATLCPDSSECKTNRKEY